MLILFCLFDLIILFSGLYKMISFMMVVQEGLIGLKLVKTN